jgi:hypothetical protein
MLGLVGFIVAWIVISFLISRKTKSKVIIIGVGFMCSLFGVAIIANLMDGSKSTSVLSQVSSATDINTHPEDSQLTLGFLEQAFEQKSLWHTRKWTKTSFVPGTGSGATGGVG